MRISSKGRYALAAITYIAREGNSGENISLNDIASALGISKLYLEQVFTQLKKAELVSSVKGARGGYRFVHPPSKLTVWNVLRSVENSLAETSEPTVPDNAPDVEMALMEKVFAPLDDAIRTILDAVTIQDLLDVANHQIEVQSYMLNL
ncbi:MAG: Rrf2 family transcriptional regulator [Oscillospiraceae bacterium]|jgi:Rrf2 family protein|nr:Rrf2 family transcriptional regulator [Oscillospiraceae bacterium]